MNNPNVSIGHSQESILATNKVLKNTYMLLSATLVFSGVMAYVGMAMNAGFGMALVSNIVAIVLLWFVLPRTANTNPSIVSTALGGTGVIFLGLSGYALTTRKDFSFMGGFLMVGMLVVIVASLANIFLQMPIMSLVVSGAIVMLMSGMILYQTSAIINGGETNYIMATASLFLSLLNMFQALMHILGVFGGDD